MGYNVGLDSSNSSHFSDSNSCCSCSRSVCCSDCRVVGIIRRIGRDCRLLPSAFGVSSAKVICCPCARARSGPRCCCICTGLPRRLRRGNSCFGRTSDLLSIVRFARTRLDMLFIVFVLNFIVATKCLLAITKGHRSSRRVGLQLCSEVPCRIVLNIAVFTSFVMFPTNFLLVGRLPIITLVYLTTAVISLRTVLAACMEVETRRF